MIPNSKSKLKIEIENWNIRIRSDKNKMKSSRNPFISLMICLVSESLFLNLIRFFWMSLKIFLDDPEFKIEIEKWNWKLKSSHLFRRWNPLEILLSHWWFVLSENRYFWTWSDFSGWVWKFKFEIEFWNLKPVQKKSKSKLDRNLIREK